MNDKNANIVMFTLLGAIVLFWAFLNTPININRNLCGSTTSRTIDAGKVRVNWTAKYKAPLVLPKEIREDAETKIEMYVMMRLYTFSLRYTAVEFSTLSKDMIEFQKVFDTYDLLKELAKLSPDLREKLKNIKSVRINAIEFEPAVKKFLEKEERKRNNEVIAES